MNTFHHFLSISLSGILVAFSSIICLGQNIAKLEKSAEKEFRKENFIQSLSLYEDILSEKPKHKIALYRAEICSLLSHYPTKPIDDLMKYARAGGGDKFYNYWIGRISLKKHEFDQSIEYLSKFLKQKQYKSPEIVEESKQFLAKAQKAKKFYAAESLYVVEHIDEKVNTTQDETSPMPIADNTMLFLSSLNQKVTIRDQEELIVYQTRKENNQWSQPVKEQMFGSFNSGTESLIAFNDDKNIAFFDLESRNLMQSELKNDVWNTPTVMDDELSRYNIEGRFFVSNSGTRLIFSSNKYHKRDDLDLYEITKTSDGTWGEPQNLGTMVNSDKDEYSPFITNDGKRLYFSSKGHNAIGGYDIFYTDFNETTSRWTVPVQMDYPINTIDNDIHFVLSQDEAVYFASDRYGTIGGYDLFSGQKNSLTTTSNQIVAQSEPQQRSDNDININIYGDKTLYDIEEENKPEKEALSVVNRFNNIYFNYDCYKLEQEEIEYLRTVASILKSRPEAKLAISSHSDNLGFEDRNLRISEQRAESVVEILKRFGVNNELIIKTYGSQQPLASNDDEFEGRQLNRRVEMEIVK